MFEDHFEGEVTSFYFNVYVCDVNVEGELVVIGVDWTHVEGIVLEKEFDLKRCLLDGKSAEDRLLQVESSFLQLSRYFDHVRHHFFCYLGVLLLVGDGGFDVVVDVEGRAAVGAAVVVDDLFYFIFFRVDSSPGGLVGDGDSVARDAVDDDDGVGDWV